LDHPKEGIIRPPEDGSWFRSATEVLKQGKNIMISKVNSRAACLAEQNSNPRSFSNCPDLQGGVPGLPRRKIRTNPPPGQKTCSFFVHIALGTDARIVTCPQATTNMLIEVNETALLTGANRKHLKISTLTELQRVKLARGVAKTAALDYLKSESEFSNFPLQRFVDFNLTQNATYISICPTPTKVMADDSKIWRLAQSESDKLRVAPLNDEEIL
jgi:hypothetical protein